MMGLNMYPLQPPAWTRVILIMACMAMLMGCQPFGNALRYAKIPTRHLLLIPQQGTLHMTWEARHLTITFKGKVRQNLLTIHGNILRGEGIRRFSTLDDLVVDVYFTNSSGAVLQHEAFHSMNNSPLNKVLHTFQSRFELPKGGTHIAFGYDGKADGQHFHHNPFN